MRYIRTAAAVFLAGMLLSGCHAEDDSADKIIRSGVVRIAIESNDNVLLDVSEHIASELGVSADYIIADRSAALDMIALGSADVAVGFYPQSDNPGLEFNTTTPFCSENIYAVCREEMYVGTVRELEGMLLGADVSLSDSVVRTISGLSADGMLYCTDKGKAAVMLNSGELDAYLCFENDALELIKAHSALRCYTAADLGNESYSAVVLRSKAQLYGRVNGAIGDHLTGGN